MVRTSSVTMPSIVGIVGRALAEDEKVWCFLVCVSVMCNMCLLFVMFLITEMLWSSVVFKTIMLSLHRGRFVVPIFNFFCGPPKFSLRGNCIPKIAIFEAVGPHFKAKTMKFGMQVRTWDSLTQFKFYKNRVRGYTLFRKIYTKNYQFRIFGAISPHFKSDNG